MSTFRSMTLLALSVAGCTGGTDDPGSPATNPTSQVGPGPAGPGGHLPVTLPAPTIAVDDFSGYLDISTSAAGTVRYTLDGSAPTPTSTLYTGSFFPTCTSESAVVNAAVFSDVAASPVATQQFSQHPFSDGVLFSPVQTRFEGSGRITLTSPGSTAIYYTLDGTAPTTASTLYTGPITFDHSMKIAVVAVMGPDGCGHPGGQYSAVSYGIYTVDP